MSTPIGEPTRLAMDPAPAAGTFTPGSVPGLPDLADLLPGPLIVLDRTGQVRLWNAGANALFGWSAAEAADRSWKESLFRNEPGRADEILAAFQGDDRWTGECQAATRDGGIVPVELRCLAIPGPDGRTESLAVLATDLRERHALEQRMMRAQKLESIGTLACGVAHDLNNILAGLSIAVDLLRSKESSPEMRDFMQALQASVHRASDMIRQMLSFSKGIQGESIPLSLGSMVKEIVRICQATFPPNLRFRTNIAQDLWDVVGNATKLHQAVLNLATNARDAMPDGGTLSISVENAEIDEDFAHGRTDLKPGPQVRLLVQDTGTGIAPEVKDRIFDPFFTTKGPEKGTGLGLTMVLDTVREHAGIIECDSTPGQGTTFRVYLPACPANPRAVSRRDAFGSFAGGGRTVLLVDADPPTRNLMKAVLVQFQLKVIVAADGIDALNAFATHHDRIWAVITEMDLQHIDGMQLVRAIRRISPPVPVIGVIPFGDAARRADLESLDVHLFLQKPFTGTEVAEVLALIPAE